jgi:pseudaminic acid synthase
MQIANRSVSHKASPFVIAEMSGNHNGDINRAKKLIEVAKWAGADAVKLQTYLPDTITIRSDRPEFRINSGLWKGRTLYELYEEAHTPWEWHAELFAHAERVGIILFSAPFDATAVDLLESLNAPAYKIASAEVIDWGLLERVASPGKPVIVSSGMATDQELEEALNILKTNGASNVVLLHCISSYPAPLAETNLRRIPYLADKFQVLTGLSDHTMGKTAAIAAVALGAVIVEKHFTLAREDGGVDASFSLEEEELKDLCHTLVEVHASLQGNVVERPASETETRLFRRSLYFIRSLKAGQEITREDLKSIRPGAGLLPRHLKDIIGKKAAADIQAGTPTAWSLIKD